MYVILFFLLKINVFINAENATVNMNFVSQTQLRAYSLEDVHNVPCVGGYQSSSVLLSQFCPQLLTQGCAGKAFPAYTPTLESLCQCKFFFQGI